MTIKLFWWVRGESGLAQRHFIRKSAIMALVNGTRPNASQDGPLSDRVRFSLQCQPDISSLIVALLGWCGPSNIHRPTILGTLFARATRIITIVISAINRMAHGWAQSHEIKKGDKSGKPAAYFNAPIDVIVSGTGIPSVSAILHSSPRSIFRRTNAGHAVARSAFFCALSLPASTRRRRTLEQCSLHHRSLNTARAATEPIVNAITAINQNALRKSYDRPTPVLSIYRNRTLGAFMATILQCCWIAVTLPSHVVHPAHQTGSRRFVAVGNGACVRVGVRHVDLLQRSIFGRVGGLQNLGPFAFNCSTGAG